MGEQVLVHLLIEFPFKIPFGFTARKQQQENNSVLTKVTKLKLNPMINLILLLIMLSFNCDTTEPPIIDNPKKEYRWTETKLLQPQGKGVVPIAVWGSDTNDIWAVGWNTSWQGEIFHYDGIEWKNVTPPIQRNTIYNDIFGFSNNDIYVVGYTWWQQPTRFLLSCLILHYNGTNWSMVVEDSTNQGFLNKIHGNSKNNIWAVGGNGSIYHFSGGNWQRKPFIDSLDILSVFCLPTNQVYTVYQYDSHNINDDYRLLYFGEYLNNWSFLKDTCRISLANGKETGYKFGYKAMWGVANDKLISVGPWYWKYNGAGWSLIYSTTYPLNDIKGISWNDIYGVGDHGTIIYFNGQEWTYIGKYGSTTVDFKSIMPFEKAIYILGYYQGDAWIIKGEVIN